MLEGTGKRFYLNMISAITNAGLLMFMVVDGPFNGKVFLRFLEKLVKSASHKIFLIADSHPVHVQKKVSCWLQVHRKEIEMFFMPTYSPELNPDEYFNQDLNTNLLGKARPRNKQQLKILVQKFARKKKRNPEKVKKYFHPNAVNYAS